MRSIKGEFLLIEHKGKMYVMPKTDATYDLIGREVLRENTNDSEWLFLAAMTIDMESKEVKKSRFF